jgi:hypothetical protein
MGTVLTELQEYTEALVSANSRLKHLLKRRRPESEENSFTQNSGDVIVLDLVSVLRI